MKNINDNINALRKWLGSNKRWLIVGTLFVIVAFVVVSAIPLAAHAQQAPAGNQGQSSNGYQTVQGGSFNALTTPGNYLTKEFWIGLAASILLYLAQLGIKITLFLFTFLVQVSAYNGYLDATAVNVGWVMIRDLTNMLFVVILLVVAFGTILGIEQYEWKKMLVQFVIAAVLVNFSRLICGVLIDISQLLMTTFINGIVATAGGNLINAFGLQRIINVNSSVQPNQLSAPGIFAASVMAVVFSFATVYTIGIFVFMMVARLIRLWVLIVLSPMAFVLSVLPQTAGAASKWWSELTDNLVTGPVVLFFIWLSFVTVGAGQINDEISQNAQKQVGINNVVRNSGLDADQVGPQISFSQSAGPSDALGWNQMASFIVAIGMLIAGAEVASSIGGSSGSALTGVADFAKKVGTIASGYVAGRWAYGKLQEGAQAVAEGAKKAGSFVALDVLPLRHYGELIKNTAQQQWDTYQTAKHLRAGEMVPVFDDKGQIVGEKAYEPSFWMQTLHVVGRADRARAIAISRKKAEKTQKLREYFEENTMKDVKGVPSGVFIPKSLQGDGFDRWMQGKIEAKSMRSQAKTADITGKAIAAEMQSVRSQYDPSNPKADANGFVRKDDEGSLANAIANHNLNTQKTDALRAKVDAAAKLTLVTKEGRDGTMSTALRDIALLKEQTATSEAAFNARQTKETRETLAANRSVLNERVAKEKEEHLEHEKEEELRKQAETAFYGSDHGVSELLEEAEIARRMKAMEENIATGKARAEGLSAITEADSLKAAQLSAMQTAGFKSTAERIEKEAQAEVAQSYRGNAALRQQEEEKYKTANAAEDFKLTQAQVKREAAKNLKSVIQQKEERALGVEEQTVATNITEASAKRQAALENTETIANIQQGKIDLETAQLAFGKIGDDARKGILQAAREKADELRKQVDALLNSLKSDAENAAEAALQAARKNVEQQITAIDDELGEERAKIDKKVDPLLTDAQQKRDAILASPVAEEVQKFKSGEGTGSPAIESASKEYVKAENDKAALTERLDQIQKELFATGDAGKKKQLEATKAKLEADLRVAKKDPKRKADIQKEINKVDNELKRYSDPYRQRLEAEQKTLSQGLEDNTTKQTQLVNTFFPAMKQLDELDKRIEQLNEERKDGYEAAAKAAGEKRKEVSEKAELPQKQKAVQDAKNVRERQEERTGTAEYIKKEQVVSEVQKLEKSARADSVVEHVFVKQEAATAKAALDEADQVIRQTLLGFQSMQSLFKDEQARQLGSEAAKQFAEGIKQKKIADIFKGAADDFSKKVQKAMDQGVSFEKIDFEDNIAGRVAQAKVLADFTKDMVDVARSEVSDAAKSAMSLERYGFETPASAYEELVGKRMKDYANVERERAVSMAIGSLSKLVRISKSGASLDADQRAQMMANNKYLTSQAWSDDLLAAIANKIEMKNRGMLTKSSEIEEAEALEDVFIQHFHWGEVDKDGKLKLDQFKNRSGSDRTNDLHRLSAVGGRTDTVQSENAVLRHARAMKMDVDEAALHLGRLTQEAMTTRMVKNDLGQTVSLANLVEQSRTAVSAAEAQTIKAAMSELARTFGITGAAAGEELQAFARQFVKQGAKAKDIMDGFLKEIGSHNQAYEMMTSFKNLALQNGHIDDGGHTFYDSKLKMSRGQLWDDALSLVLSDWRKLPATQRANKLKSHTIAYMDEKSSTVLMTPELRAVIRETFNGMATSRIFEQIDGRVKDHIAGLSAGEKVKADSITGAMIVGHKDSTVYAQDFKHIADAQERQKAAFEQVANNWATMLAEAPVVLAASLGERSNVKFDDAVRGVFNLKLGFDPKTFKLPPGLDKKLRNGNGITNVQELIAFVKAYATNPIKNEISQYVVERALQQGVTQEKKAA